MTKEELIATHPEYDIHLERWQFFMRSYFGGKYYRDGNYLLQHPFESSTNYERRKNIAYFYNYCAPIVDIYSSHLYRKQPKREFGGLSEDTLLARFLRDANLEGDSFSKFMREAQRFASIYSRVSVIVDKPSVEVDTKADAEEQGIYPYVNLITPENMLDWKYERLPSGRPVLAEVKICEARNKDGKPIRFRVWTREAWQLWGLGKARDKDVELLEEGEHPLGEIPIVPLYNKQSSIKMIGISDLEDIADINKNIYYLCSDAKEIIENTAFPMLAIPYEKGGDDEKEIGPRNIIQFDPEVGAAKPYWLEAPHSSLKELREWVKQDIGEIHRIAKMRSVFSVDGKQPRSGTAIDIENNQMHSILAEKADNAEEAENEIFRFWALWQDKEFDGVVDYADDFSVRDLERDMDNMLKAVSLKIPSITFTKEAYKRVSGGVLPKLDDETKKQIIKEIEEAVTEESMETENDESTADGVGDSEDT